MTRYEITRNSLSDALSPVVAYCQRAHETLEATDPAQSGRWWHVNQLDALTTAIIDYGEEAEKAQEALKSQEVGSIAIQEFCARVRASMARIDRIYPAGSSPLRGSINSYCLPAPILDPNPMASPFEQFRNAGTPVTPKAELPSGPRPEIWADWAGEWIDYYTQEPCPLTILVPVIDADQEQSLKGKLAVFIGTGGTRKSYYVKQTIATNILSYGSRVIYSSMEMGKPEVVNRFLDMVISPEGGECASAFLKRAVRVDRESVTDYLASCAQVLHDNLVLSNNSGKTVADYERLILDTMAAYGPVDVLAIDGLSAMGGGGDETQRFNQITLDLKELAKKYNLFIMLVCHTTKSAKGYTRDSREFVRGSEKILDNADFSMCFSNIIDWRQSTPDNIMFIKGLAHIKYYNKRGSGMMLNQLMEFDGLTKSFSVSPGMLHDFPDYDTFVREYNAEKRKAERRDNTPF